MKYVFLLLIFAMAASAERSVCGTEELLPINYTKEELATLDEVTVNTIPTSPPPEGVINPAEYDPATGIMIRWPMGLPYDLIVAMSQETKVWVICESGQQSSVESAFTSAGVNMSNVDYILAETNSIWVRDYGPWFVLLDDGTQGIFNYTYNRFSRPDDNQIPVEIGAAWGIPVYTSTIVHTGGNYMSSGYHQAMSTELVYDENGGDEDWVDSQMELYLGISDYVTMEDPQSSYIDHIDCWGKMLSPGKVLVLQVPPSSGDYAALEATADLLANTPSPYGTDWQVYRVYSSGTEGYTNSLISEQTVYVPLWGTGNDAAAIASYQNAMPGYDIQGFEYGGWEPTDALHCRTRNVIDNQMLFVRHIPVDAIQPANIPVPVDALIRCHPSNTLTDESVYYRVGTSGNFTQLAMTPCGDDSFSVDIPATAPNQTVQYYVSASDDSGRNETMPRFAPDTWFYQYQTGSTGIGSHDPERFGVHVGAAGPNPFSVTASIPYSAAAPVPVSMMVCDISGRVVYRSFAEVEAGEGKLVWTPSESVPSGVYIIRVEGTGWQHTQRVTFFR